MQHGNWNYPTAVQFGAGRIIELPDACVSLGIRKPLLVTDPGLASLPMVQSVLDTLRARGLEPVLFGEAQPNPEGENVALGLSWFKSHQCDGVIPFGGGSALDVGKTIALMAGQTRELWDFIDVGDNWTRVDPNGIAPMVAVPTTAGTGSEVGRASVIIRESTRTKCIIFHPRMLPERVICDPLLTVGLPPKLTAAVGMDALSHNLEAYCAPGYHPLADGIAAEGIRLVAEHLETVVSDGQNIEARAGMMSASLMGATAFQKGLGAMHALAHPLGAHHALHHGLLNAILMPYVLQMNRPAIEKRLHRLGAYLALEEPTFDGFLGWVLRLRASIGIPHTLGDVGLGDLDVAQMAELAIADPSAGTNPVTMTSENTERLLKAAIGG